MRARRRILDADAHVIEPMTLFGDVLPAGVPFLDLPETTPTVPCGDATEARDLISHGFGAASYLRAMDREGIDGVVLYPSTGLFVPYMPELTTEAAERACRTYNEWVAGYCEADPTRLAAVGVVPLRDVERTVDVARQASELRLCGVTVRPNFLYGRTLGDAAYDPFYRCLVERDLVLGIHEGLGLRGASTLGTDRFRSFTARHACSHAMEQMAGLASLILDGAFERHPRLRVVLLESGSGWVPYWLDRLDSHVEWMRGTETGHLTLAPSEYFERQCVVSTESEDSLAGLVIGRYGADRLVWASDFPHPDALYPDAVTTFLDEMEKAGVDAEDVAKVLWETPLRLYGLEQRFAGRSRSDDDRAAAFGRASDAPDFGR